MEYYISKLIKCGYSRKDANNIYISFLKDHSIFDLVHFIDNLEKERLQKCG